MSSVVVQIDYTNYKGERSIRTVVPTGKFAFKSTFYHRDEQWILEAIDLNKNAIREFAVKDIHRWIPVAANSWTRANNNDNGEATEARHSRDGDERDKER